MFLCQKLALARTEYWCGEKKEVIVVNAQEIYNIGFPTVNYYIISPSACCWHYNYLSSAQYGCLSCHSLKQICQVSFGHHCQNFLFSQFEFWVVLHKARSRTWIILVCPFQFQMFRYSINYPKFESRRVAQRMYSKTYH